VSNEKLEAELAKVRAERDALKTALDDLISWFPKKPSPPEWRIQGGQYGADDAVAAARALLVPVDDED